MIGQWRKKRWKGEGWLQNIPSFALPGILFPAHIWQPQAWGVPSLSESLQQEPNFISGQWPPGSEHPDLGKQVCQRVEQTEAWQVTSTGSEEEGSARLSICLQPAAGQHYVLHSVSVEMEAIDAPLPRLASPLRGT